MSYKSLPTRLNRIKLPLLAWGFAEPVTTNRRVSIAIEEVDQFATKEPSSKGNTTHHHNLPRLSNPKHPDFLESAEPYGQLWHNHAAFEALWFFLDVNKNCTHIFHFFFLQVISPNHEIPLLIRHKLDAARREIQDGAAYWSYCFAELGRIHVFSFHWIFPNFVFHMKFRMKRLSLMSKETSRWGEMFVWSVRANHGVQILQYSLSSNFLLTSTTSI